MTPIVVFEMEDGQHSRFFKFDLDAGKDFCYRSRVSHNAFFSSRRRRNKSGRHLYISRSEEEHLWDVEVWDRTRERYPNIPALYRELPTVNVGSLWEFYEVIGYDYKTKKWRRS